MIDVSQTPWPRVKGSDCEFVLRSYDQCCVGDQPLAIPHDYAHFYVRQRSSVTCGRLFKKLFDGGGWVLCQKLVLININIDLLLHVYELRTKFPRKVYRKTYDPLNVFPTLVRRETAYEQLCVLVTPSSTLRTVLHARNLIICIICTENEAKFKNEAQLVVMIRFRISCPSCQEGGTLSLLSAKHTTYSRRVAEVSLLPSISQQDHNSSTHHKKEIRARITSIASKSYKVRSHQEERRTWTDDLHLIHVVLTIAKREKPHCPSEIVSLLSFEDIYVLFSHVLSFFFCNH